MYNKIFTKILDSSIWLETDSTRLVWLTMIASMDENGFCAFAAPGNVANRARVNLAAATEAIRVLESPDKESADPDNEGRRLDRVPGGWIVLNAAKYREIVTRAISQEQTRERVARFRAKKHPVTLGNASVTRGNVSVTPSEADTESETSKHPPKSPSADAEARAIYEAYPRHKEPKQAIKAIQKAMKEGRPASFLLAATKAYANAVSLWPSDEKQYVPYPATWFNAGSYDEDPVQWIRTPTDSEPAEKPRRLGFGAPATQQQ